MNVHRNRGRGAEVSPEPVLASLVTFGTPAGRCAVPTRPLSDGAWGALLDQVRRNRLVLLLGAAIDDGWPVTDSQAEAFAAERRRATLAALSIERELVRAGSVLNDAGIPFVVLKGLATAHLVYPEPHWRQSGDVDLWVSESDYGGALRALQVAGYQVLNRPLLGSTWEKLRNAQPLAGPSGIEVDLHRRIKGTLPSQRLPGAALDSTRPFRVGGQELRAMHADGMLLHACLHLGGATRLSTLADLIRLHGDGLRFSESLVAEIAPITAATVEWALSQARLWADLPTAPYEEQLRRVATKRARLKQRYAQTSPKVAPVLTLMDIPSRHRASAALQMVAPDREFLRYVGRTRSQQLTKLARTLAAIIPRGDAKLRAK